jgi:hypothetical protein
MSFPFPATHTHRDAVDPEVKLTVDNRFYPIVLAQIHGGWAEDTIDYYFLRWRNPLAEHAHSEGKAIIVIFDLTASKPPSAILRKRAGDYAQHDKDQVGFLKSIMIVTNPLIRGIITAINWLAGDVPIALVKSVPDALRMAVEQMAKSGIEHPKVDPDTYQFPPAE